MTGRVKARVEDDEAQSQFAAELRSMATTGMTTEFVENLFLAVPEEKSWAVGEALAECVLADDETREVCWPWNLVRDRRTPRASLPGADLVGFCKEGDDVLLLFGEVKTSSDARTPPNVMSGRGGMAWQLKDEATRPRHPARIAEVASRAMRICRAPGALSGGGSSLCPVVWEGDPSRRDTSSRHGAQ